MIKSARDDDPWKGEVTLKRNDTAAHVYDSHAGVKAQMPDNSVFHRKSYVREVIQVLCIHNYLTSPSNQLQLVFEVKTMFTVLRK